MENNCTITITGRQIASGDIEKLSLTTLGQFTLTPKEAVIRYEESETTGFAGDVTTLSIEGNRRATLTRFGKTFSTLVIEKGTKHMCHYDTGEGNMVIGILADKIDNRLDEHGGELELRYRLDVNSNAVSINELNISVHENQPNA